MLSNAGGGLSSGVLESGNLAGDLGSALGGGDGGGRRGLPVPVLHGGRLFFDFARQVPSEGSGSHGEGGLVLEGGPVLYSLSELLEVYALRCGIGALREIEKAHLVWEGGGLSRLRELQHSTSFFKRLQSVSECASVREKKGVGGGREEGRDAGVQTVHCDGCADRS